MEISGSYTLYAPRERVWEYLLDPAVLARTVPGCETLETEGEDRYRGRMNVGIAAVKGVYEGTLRVTERAEPEHYKMLVDGGGARGVMHGEGTVSLEARGSSTTIVTYQGQAQLGGAVASVGMRVASGAARMLVNQFFARLADALAEAAPGGSPEAGTNGASTPVATQAPVEAAVTVGSETQWGSGLPEALPLSSERVPTEATRIERSERQEPATPPPSPTRQPAPAPASATTAGSARTQAAGVLTRFIRRSGLSDGSIESEQRIARRLLGAGAAVAATLVLGVAALLSGWRRSK
jgi:carbon monoxide dehydrogenase subunit G